MSSERPSRQIPPIFLADVELAQQVAAEYQQSGDPTPLKTAIAAWGNILSHPNFAAADATFQFVVYHDEDVSMTMLMMQFYKLLRVAVWESGERGFGRGFYWAAFGYVGI